MAPESFKWALAVPQKDEFLRLVINSVRNDLISRNEAFQCLALDFVANGGWRVAITACHFLSGAAALLHSGQRRVASRNNCLSPSAGFGCIMAGVVPTQPA